MAQFSYTAYEPSGRRVTGEIEAPSRTTALEVLASQGCYPSALDEPRTARAHWARRDLFGDRTLSVQNLGSLTRELASLLHAGLPVDECLRLIALQPMLPTKVQRTVRALEASVAAGQSLSASMAAQGAAFPEFYWRLVHASETSGALDTALEELATYLEATASMRSRLVSALIYPAILLVAAVIALGVVAGLLIPALAPLFEEARVPPPALISVIAAVEIFVRAYWAWFLLVGAGIAIAGVFLMASNAAKLAFHRGLLRVPVVGSIIERRETGRLARTLGTLIKGGVPLVEATHIAASVMTNRAMADKIEAASQEIREGGILSEPLSRSGLFSQLFVRLVALGEQSGQLEAMLFRAANIYDGTLGLQLQRLIGLITPVVTVVIGGAVGVLILSVMSALMSINELAVQ